MKRRIFITGGTGFVGGHLLAQIPPEWEAFASFRSQKYPFPHVNWIQLELTDFARLEKLLSELQPDVILHAAALANLDQVATNPATGNLVNVQLTQRLADFAEQRRIRIIFISSDMVFDGTQGGYRETDLPHPLNEYGQNKLAAENWLQNHCSNYVIARSSLVYGVSRTDSHSFAEEMLRRWKRQEPVTLFYDQYRSPILVDNLARALLELAELDYSGIVHLGGAERVSRLDFGMLFAKILSIRTDLIRSTSMYNGQSAVQRPADTSFVITRAQEILKTEFLDCRAGIQFWLDHYSI
jgi:dTDP-4-dehydrorhamnose reductase